MAARKRTLSKVRERAVADLGLITLRNAALDFPADDINFLELIVAALLSVPLPHATARMPAEPHRRSAAFRTGYRSPDRTVKAPRPLRHCRRSPSRVESSSTSPCCHC